MKSKVNKTMPYAATRQTLCLAVAGLCVGAASSHGQILFQENFESQTLGANPTGFTVNLPGAPTPGTLETTVVAFGGGQGLQLLDQSATANAQVQQDFTVSSAVRMSFSFARNQNIVPASATSSLFVSLGYSGGNQPAAASRTMAIKLLNNGTFGFERGTQDLLGGYGGTTATSVTGVYEQPSDPFSTHTMEIFAYAGTIGGSGITYTGPDALVYSLSARSYSVFLDGALVTTLSDSLSTGVYGFSSGGYAVSGDMGRFGFVTGGATARVGMDFTVDNLLVEVIPVPEPSAFALFGLGLVIMGRQVARRRKG